MTGRAYRTYLRPWGLAARTLFPRPIFARARRRVAGRAAIVAVGGGIVLVASTGVGYAYWRATGTGTGSAPTGAVSLSVPGTASATGSLYPSASVTATLDVTNPSSSAAAVTLSSVTAGSVTSGTSGCAGHVSFTPASSSSLSAVTINPGATAHGVSVGTFTMDATAPGSCQGASFSVTVTVSGKDG